MGSIPIISTKAKRPPIWAVFCFGGDDARAQHTLSFPHLFPFLHSALFPFLFRNTQAYAWVRENAERERQARL